MLVETNILLTIIIPHRNISHLLRRCLESIPERNDIQVIVVDDCSEESIAGIINQYQRIEVYNTSSHSGGGAARNIGLSHAKGQWITCIDADDFFTSRFSCIVDSLKLLPAETDVLYCSANSLDSEFLTTSDRANTLNRYINLHQKNNPEGDKRLRFTFGEPWCKIVRRTLIEKAGISFSESSIHNDTRYSYLVGFHANKIESTQYALCTITTRSGSVSKILSESKKLERITIFAEAHKFFRDNCIPEKYVINFLWSQMARSRFENTATYREGCKILHSYGFTSTEIVIQTLKHTIRNSAVVTLKKLIERIR